MKITLTDLVNLENQTTAVNAINANNAILETALDNTLSRDGTLPNTMGSTLDMNSHTITNLPTPTSNYEPLRLIDRTSLNAGVPITVSTLPTGGTINQVLAKNSSTNFDASWKATSTIPTGGTAGTVLTKNSGTDYDASFLAFAAAVPTGGSTGQVLAKNSATNYDASWKYANATVVTPEQFGYTGTGDAGVYINTAINSTGTSGVTVQLGPGTYTITTPILVTKFSVWIKGSGDVTQLVFAPTGANQTCITYNASPVTTGIYYGRITDLRIYSNDTTYVKTAINLVDVGNMIISGVIVGTSWTDTATRSCVCLKTNGRQCTTFADLGLFGDKPIVIKANPNFASLCTDHFHFRDLLLQAHSGSPCITADSGVVFTNTTFDGYQAWVLGTYGFYYDGTTAASRSYNLSFSNVRSEGGSSATAYTFYVNATGGGMFGLSFKNCTPDPTRKGFFLRNSFSTLSDIYFSNAGAVEVLNVDATCISVRVDNLRVEAAATQSVGALTTKYSYNYTGAPAGVPANALYES